MEASPEARSVPRTMRAGLQASPKDPELCSDTRSFLPPPQSLQSYGVGTGGAAPSRPSRLHPPTLRAHDSEMVFWMTATWEQSPVLKLCIVDLPPNHGTPGNGNQHASACHGPLHSIPPTLLTPTDNSALLTHCPSPVSQ